jgi:hypothetical protein
MEEWNIKGHDVEFIDDTHTYLVDGVIVPSITQILKVRFNKKYDGIPRETLQRASEKGTQMHEVIERWCKNGEESDLVELRNFKFLKRQYNFSVLKNEVPVLLWHEGDIIGAGRLDMVIEMNGQVGLADLKRTSVLDKEYLGYQLNLYRFAYQQSYGEEIEFLRGIHLREDVRKFVKIPINEELTIKLIEEWREQNE